MRIRFSAPCDATDSTVPTSVMIPVNMLNDPFVV